MVTGAGTTHALRGGDSGDDPLKLSPAVVERHTAQDPVLRQVSKWVKEDWPATCPSTDFSAYFNKREELSTFKGCLLWEARVVVPEGLRSREMEVLRDFHVGVKRTKSVARLYV